VKRSIRLPLFVALTVFLSIALGCGRPTQRDRSSLVQATAEPTPLPNREAETYAVLSAVIKDLYVDANKSLLVIEHVDRCPTTVDPLDPDVRELRQQMEDSAISDMPQLTPDTLEDFHAREGDCQLFKRSFDIPVQYELVTAKQLNPLFPKGEYDRWYRRFYRKYPNSSGIINFSNPGFNGAFTQALVSTGRVCGGLCGSGYFVLLEKDNGRWTVQAKVQTWVS
jgi:hypothetical protein